jgi:hypothetical protein
MKAWAGLIGGCVLGFLAAIIVNLAAPDLLTPYLQVLSPVGQPESVKGMVVTKQRESDRLLLTLSTPNGVLLATFTEKIDDIDLLIAEGNSITIRLKANSPFVENPTVEKVEIDTKDQRFETPSTSMQ